MYHLRSLIIFAVLIIYSVSFDVDKKMNPILRHFAQQDRARPLMSAFASSKPGGYRNCYLSPIQCHLPMRREQQQNVQLSQAIDGDEMSRIRRMLFPMS